MGRFAGKLFAGPKSGGTFEAVNCPPGQSVGSSKIIFCSSPGLDLVKFAAVMAAARADNDPPAITISASFSS
jgi:hypothetical protein